MSITAPENGSPTAGPPVGMTPESTLWQRFVRGLPLGLALSMVAGVWVGGAVWSFEEQTRLAERLLFAVPWLLPLVLDGLAVSLAGVAYAAALDGRAAVHARVMTALAVIASSTSNAAAAASRPEGAGRLAVVVAAGVPVAANLAFEVLLGELRRQVHRRRGLPAPVAIPSPRALRLLLAPLGAFGEWRALVLDLTAPGPSAADLAVGELRRRVAALEADEVRLRDELLEAHRATQAAEALFAPAPSEARPGTAGQVDPATNAAEAEAQAAGASSRKPVRRPAAPRSVGQSAGRSSAGRSSTAAAVARLRRQHPGWTVGQIAERAGCSERTARRHLNATGSGPQSAQAAGPESAGSKSAQEEKAKEGTGDVAA